MKSHFRQQYFEAIDLVVNSIKNRFDQEGYKMYCNLEHLLIKASQQQDHTNEFYTVCSFYGKDFQSDVLKAQLHTFGIEFQPVTPTTEHQHLTIFDINNSFCHYHQHKESFFLKFA